MSMPATAAGASGAVPAGDVATRFGAGAGIVAAGPVTGFDGGGAIAGIETDGPRVGLGIETTRGRGGIMPGDGGNDDAWVSSGS